MKTKHKTNSKTILVRDLQIHDRVLYYGQPATVIGLSRYGTSFYGTSFHSLIITFEVFDEWKQMEHTEVVLDTLHELQLNKR